MGNIHSPVLERDRPLCTVPFRMQSLWPSPGVDVDPSDAYIEHARSAPAGRPWVMMNMIESVDGAAADVGGRSGGLGGPADKAVFVAIRAVPDVIVVGAGTAIAEDYGPVRLSAPLRARRRAAGRPEVPRLAVVTASLQIDPGQRLFRDSPPGEPPPLVLTTTAADAGRRKALARVAEVVEVGDERVDWVLALRALRELAAAGVVLCEGGPSTNAQLVAADLVDEMCITVAPALVGGPAPRIAGGPDGGAARPLRLDRVLTADGYLFVRYLRDRDAP